MERKNIISCRAVDVAPPNRCAVVGEVSQKDKSGFFALKDDSGEVICLASDEILSRISVGKTYRVIGLSIENSEMKAESVLELKDYDRENYCFFLNSIRKI